jgi:hypothetical protein
LYDTDTTLKVVRKVVNWYKKYREVLNSDIIHLRRADGRDWDGIMHVQPGAVIKGLVMVFNPLNEPISRTIKLPLYATGLEKTAKISEKGKTPVVFTLNRSYETDLTIQVPARGYSWWIIE